MEDSRLTHVVLGSDPLVLAVHRSHPLAAQQTVAIGELRNHCLLMREAGSTTRQLTEAMLQQAGVVPASMLEIGSRESIREAVIRNLGVSLIARQEVPDNPELRVLEVQGAPLMDEYLYCLKDRRQARLPSAFLALARNADG
ncbi:HTH-type transcriptional regulator CysL [compost metagenome]